MSDVTDAFAAPSNLLNSGNIGVSRDGRGTVRGEERRDEGGNTHGQSGLPYRWCGAAPVIPELTPARRRALALKRLLDIVLAAIALVVLSPLLLAIFFAIRLSGPGPALFRQVRAGRGDRPFTLLKFRTMFPDRGDHTGIAQTIAGDDRVTRVGALLRRTSLDELPQLWNVLRGEMSLVGPRAHVFGMRAGGMEYERLVPYYALRHAMPPGISGWAQVNRLRGPTEDAARARARIDHDIAYIQNFSVWLDIRIIWLTLWREFVAGTGV
jgi:lipopolysaccharide/colanic/teichoic acid biosynthesis glycosyltransferase